MILSAKGGNYQKEGLGAQVEGSCPSDDALAIYLDSLCHEEPSCGQICGATRGAVERHIAQCPECFEVYTEALRFDLEHPEE